MHYSRCWPTTKLCSPARNWFTPVNQRPYGTSPFQPITGARSKPLPRKNIKTKVVDHKEFSEREDFDNKVHEVLLENNVDFLCNAGFMRIHGEKFVEKWFNKHLNIHPSLLPSFKGLNTHERAIKSGVKFAGCTVHLVRSGVDEGPIIGQAITSIDINDDKISLAEKVLKLEHKLYPKCLKLFTDKLVKVKNNKIIFSDKAIEVLNDFKV